MRTTRSNRTAWRAPRVSNDVAREILLSFWKVHILHHASEHPLVGHWMLDELRRHGYDVSPGTLYPVLKRMAARGWLRCTVVPPGGLRARREYRLTPRGRQVLDLVREYVAELRDEVRPRTSKAPKQRVSNTARRSTPSRRERRG